MPAFDSIPQNALWFPVNSAQSRFHYGAYFSTLPTFKGKKSQINYFVLHMNSNGHV